MGALNGKGEQPVPALPGIFDVKQLFHPNVQNCGFDADRNPSFLHDAARPFSRTVL